jgi:hypothetical protein
MKAFIATVDLVIRAQSWAEACDGVSTLLTEAGMHDAADPVLFDWAYIPEQIQSAGDWPKEIALPEGWPERPEEERNVYDLFSVRPHVEPMLVMSTAHLGPLDREYLDSGTGIVIANAYGWIVYAKQKILPGLMPLLDFAQKHGCLWIKFDAGGPEFSEFPAFDWEG